MGDVQDGQALPSEVAQDREETKRLFAGQGRGGLVEDEHARTLQQDPRDLHHLLLGHAELPRPRADGNVSAQGVEDFSRAPLHLPEVQDEAARLAPEEHVGRGRELGHESQLLVDHGHTPAARGRGVAEGQRLAAQQDDPRVGHDRAGQGLDQGALARAVLAHERVDLAARTPGQALDRPRMDRRGEEALDRRRNEIGLFMRKIRGTS